MKKIVSTILDEQEKNYIRIKLSWLELKRSYDFNLFTRVSGKHMLFCRKSLTLTPEMLKKLSNRDAAWVEKEDESQFREYMEEHLEEIVLDETRSMKERSEAVYATTTALMDDLLESPNAPNILRVQGSIQSQMRLVHKNPGALHSMMSLTSHDYYTYTHSVNVSVYLTALAKRMELSRRETTEVALGGMLHDLGKAKVALEIINFPGKLDEKQFEEIKKHPRLGVELLKALDPEQKMVPVDCYHAIEQHHEKFCGKGYPSGDLKGKDIHLYGRMTKVTDVFDAISTRRSYKNAMSAFETLNIMKTVMLKEFDPEILEHFIHVMADYSDKVREERVMI